MRACRLASTSTGAMQITQSTPPASPHSTSPAPTCANTVSSTTDDSRTPRAATTWAPNTAGQTRAAPPALPPGTPPRPAAASTPTAAAWHGRNSAGTRRCTAAQQPRGRGAEDVRGQQRLLIAVPRVPRNLGQPIRVAQEGDEPGCSLQPVHKEKTAQEPPVEAAVEDGQIAANFEPVLVRVWPPGLPDLQQHAHLEDREERELEKGGGGEGVEESFYDDARREMREALVCVQHRLEAHARQGHLGHPCLCAAVLRLSH
eukprot:CAMPEP_0181356206 /NCGR_PEP_ID=MMETSP1106-20121128/4301_1 /TAXON_ID=81844 /ORGANISM="Mantoniella antarctica, Strain SL-175" /LENGTH=258 /DNA_ID=CAMNT_0023468981 /DNA_START=178 /DNA_END=956 /DNA_ORIENTATION=+